MVVRRRGRVACALEGAVVARPPVGGAAKLPDEEVVVWSVVWSVRAYGKGALREHKVPVRVKRVEEDTVVSLVPGEQGFIAEEAGRRVHYNGGQARAVVLEQMDK